jgi:hypothetical protein
MAAAQEEDVGRKKEGNKEKGLVAGAGMEL